jgi:hypothetical protein
MKTASVAAVLMVLVACDPKSPNPNEVVAGWASSLCQGASHVQTSTSADGTEVVSCVWECSDLGDGSSFYSIDVTREPVCRTWP